MMLDTYCDRIQSCAEAAGETAPVGFHKKCVDKQKTAINCAAAVSVERTFNACVSELMDFTCDILFTESPAGDVQVNLPSSCEGVINTN